MEKKFQNICDFYVITHKLKNLIRKGWQQWDISADRLESVAEHIYGTQMLAIAFNNELELGLDIEKCILMLAIHELGESIVGDITILDGVSKEKKHELELEAITQILSPLKNTEYILMLFEEFENKSSKEAIFARMIDKMDCDLQCKFYEEMGKTDFSKPRTGIDEEVRQRQIKKGDKTMAEMWLHHDRESCDYDENFKKFSDYILSKDIFKNKK